MLAKRKKIAGDFFCGAGGFSQGLKEACEAQGYELDLIAINHWPVAIDSHSANHTYAKHLCANLESVDPKKLVPGGRMDVLLAGIECTHHSNARGGKPRNDQSRSSAWLLLKWASELYIETIIIENVREFMSWGPLGADKQPLKSKRGETFMAFIAALKSLGYRVEYKVICCADYGDPTTRERLFIIARRGSKQIVWPKPSHIPAQKITQAGLFAAIASPWRTDREIIDWQFKGESIFSRKRPLAPKTIDRIAAGLRKFGGKNAEPFLVMLYGTNDVRSVDKPVPTVTANGNHIGLAEPFLVNLKGRSDAAGIDGPVPTITTIPHVGVVEPFIVPQFGDAPARSVDRPLNTLTTTSRGVGLCIATIEPFLVNFDHGSNSPDAAVKSIDSPVPTITSKTRTGVCEPFIMSAGGPEVAPRSVDFPANTVPCRDHMAIVDPMIVKYYGTGVAKRVDEPLDTVTGTDRFGLVTPFLVQYNGKSESHSVDQPVNTITTRERFGLITTEHGTLKLDIRFRMLTNRELARAQGLPDSYILKGKKTEITKQIGNMVPRNTARALCAQVLE